MNVYVPQEIMAVSIPAIVGILIFLFKDFRSRGSYADALRSFTEITQALNKQTLKAYEERDKEHDARIKAQDDIEAKQAQWDIERAALNEKVDRVERESEEKLNNITREHARIQSQLRQEREARERGERENAAQIARLENQLQEITRERDIYRQKSERLAETVEAMQTKIEQIEKRDTGPLGDQTVSDSSTEVQHGD